MALSIALVWENEPLASLCYGVIPSMLGGVFILWVDGRVRRVATAPHVASTGIDGNADAK